MYENPVVERHEDPAKEASDAMMEVKFHFEAEKVKTLI